MRYPVFVIFFALAFLGACSQNKDYTLLVDPFIGTGADGNTFPGASVPFGGVQLSPDTRLDACGGYASADSTILGFSHTHLNGVGEPEYRDILFMPTTGKKQFAAGNAVLESSGYSSSFDHINESASPGYYSVLLKDFDINVELTATQRSGFHRYTFPETDSAHIVIDLTHPGGAEELYLKKVSDTEIEGLRRSHGWAWDQYIYFVARFSKPFASMDLVVNDTLHSNLSEAKSQDLKALVNYKTTDKEIIMVKVGISAVSADGARKNLDAEIKNWNFDKVKNDARKAWNKELARIEVEGGSADQQKIFYTSMYHAFLSPNIFMDVDGQYRGVDHQVHKVKGFTNYTVFSLWDTYRVLHPLFTIIDKKRSADFIKTLLQHYDDGGHLPMWPLAGNYTDDMLGYHSIPVIADAYMKGIRDFDAEKAFKAMKNSAELDKLGLKYYKQTGFLPCERQGESVSKTLEYCYDDWCISQMAKAMNKTVDYETYHQRAHYWENVFDTTSGFMRGKTFDHQWLFPFNPLENSAYSEGNAYQYMYVPHDMEGLIQKMGGDQKFSDWLDTLFTLQTGRNHRGSIGQYWHGNEPSHHLPYLYNYTGQAWKTQRLVNRILNELYTTQTDGLAGNDDCGQISAWYILSSMGFYPVVPGQTFYAIGAPIFPKVTIHLEDGKNFIIRANNVSKSNIYILSAKLNGKECLNSYLRHADIMNGGELVFEMGTAPNKNWGDPAGNRPYSENGLNIPQPPSIRSGDLLFENSTKVELACETRNASIRYTLDGSEPDSSATVYDSPFEIKNNTVLKLRVYAKNMKPGIVYTYMFEKASYREPFRVQVKPGLHYDYYERFFVNTPDLDLVNPVISGSTPNVNISARKRDTYFGFRFKGYVKAPKEGIYTFFLKSNDGSRLYIDDAELIENDANHGTVEEPGRIALKAGLHKIEVKYFQCGGGKALTVEWEGPGIKKQEIPAKALFTKL